jgi:hypothetical protein
MAILRDCRRGFVALTLALASLVGCAHAPEPGSKPALVGAWRSRIQFSGGVLAPV